MLKEIELGVLSLLVSKGLQAREVTIEQAIDGAARPSCHVRITGTLPQRVSQAVWRHIANITVILIVKGDRSEKDRRHAMYPLVEAVESFLSGKSPVAGTKGIEPKVAREITASEDIDNGLSKWQIDFSCSYDTKITEDTENADDLELALMNFYRPDISSPEQPDLSAEVALQE
jgi:hypothetical protein